MAPVKFEDNLKETLEKRTIKPSSNAWDRLENRLDDSSSQKSTKPFWILGLAASLVGVFLVTTFFFKSEESPIKNETNIALEIPAIEESKQEETTIALENQNFNNQFQEKVTEERAPLKIAQGTTPKANSVTPKKVVERPVIEDLATVSENTLQEEKIKNFEAVKVDEVVAQVQELISKNQTVTEKEIDSLLDIAQQEINEQKIYNQASGKVDALALLQGVENDLEKSFRTKVLETLISSMENVATAVAQRNN